MVQGDVQRESLNQSVPIRPATHWVGRNNRHQQTPWQTSPHEPSRSPYLSFESSLHNHSIRPPLCMMKIPKSFMTYQWFFLLLIPCGSQSFFRYWKMLTISSFQKSFPSYLSVFLPLLKKNHWLAFFSTCYFHLQTQTSFSFPKFFFLQIWIPVLPYWTVIWKTIIIKSYKKIAPSFRSQDTEVFLLRLEIV